MKIIILTHPLHTNYGGLLQAYALQKTLKNMGYDAVTDRHPEIRLPLTVRLIDAIKNLTKRIMGRSCINPLSPIFPTDSQKRAIAANTERFINNHINNIDFFQGKNKPSDNQVECFDAIVVGSDQVWRPMYTDTLTYFLDFTSNINIKRISYAASFGVDNWNEFTPELTRQCAKAAQKFDAVSVREDSAVELAKTHLGIEAVHLLDPTLLLDKDNYIQLIEPQDQKENTNILMCYVLDKSNEKKAIIDKVANQLNLTTLEIMPKTRFNLKKMTNISECVYPSVSKWISGFRDAKFVVTDSFHGTVFSIIFNKPFVVIGNTNRGLTRFISLLKIFGLEDRLICSYDELNETHFQNINYIPINQLIKEWQEKSRQFLLSSLK